MKKTNLHQGPKDNTHADIHIHTVLALKLCIDQRCTSVIRVPPVQKSCRNPASSHGTRALVPLGHSAAAAHNQAQGSGKQKKVKDLKVKRSMTHSYTYILETIQAKTLKILTFKSISKMHFKCNLCFFMCLWCHYHHLSTEVRHRTCFHMGTASGETPQMPLHRQGTLLNYSPGQYSKNQGL